MTPHQLLFQSYGAHRHLHSFPTRRSSDLVERSVARGADALGDEENAQGEDDDAAADRDADQPAEHRRPSAAIAPRSEEHTSELQSPDHLVCRLLLEKKNTRHAPTFHLPPH